MISKAGEGNGKEVKIGTVWRSIESAYGPISLGFLHGALARVIFGRRDTHIMKENPSMTGAIRAFKRYFSGKRECFRNVDMDISCGSAFERKVWRALKRIPYGETRTYASIAGSIGKPKAARAVGSAIGKNPVPIALPCHRVIRSDGGLGGFSGGIDLKKNLLELEKNR